MEGADDAIGREVRPFGGGHSRGLGMVAMNLRDALAREHLSAELLELLDELFGNDLASPCDARGTGVVEFGDKSMSGKGCLSLAPCIEREISHQDLPQSGIAYHTFEDAVHTARLIFLHGVELLCQVRLMVDGRYVHDLTYQLEILPQVVALLGKMLCQNIDKGLSFGVGEGLSLKMNLFISPSIEWHQRKVQVIILEQRMQHLPFLITSHEVHTRFPPMSVAIKALQATASLRRLLQNGDLMSHPCELYTTTQPTETATKDKYLGHKRRF